MSVVIANTRSKAVGLKPNLRDDGFPRRLGFGPTFSFSITDTCNDAVLDKSTRGLAILQALLDSGLLTKHRIDNKNIDNKNNGVPLGRNASAIPVHATCGRSAFGH